jgi:hypothetical protein
MHVRNVHQRTCEAARVDQLERVLESPSRGSAWSLWVRGIARSLRAGSETELKSVNRRELSGLYGLMSALVLTALLCPAPASASTQPAESSEKTAPTYTLAYTGENLIHPGALLGVDFVPAQKGVHQLVLSPQIGVSVFSPFTTSLSLRGRAMYRIAFDFGLRLRAFALSAYYNHNFLMADVYTVEDGEVVRANDWGYGRVRLLATSGFGFDFSAHTDVPLSIFVDVGMSAEPFFGVFRFHLEHAIGVGWRF